MDDLSASILAVLAGAALGVVFYAGLWWTVRRVATMRRPATGLLIGALLRTSIALGGFHLVAGDDWARLLMCLAGFLLARAAVTRLTRPPPASSGRVEATSGAVEGLPDAP